MVKEILFEKDVIKISHFTFKSIYTGFTIYGDYKKGIKNASASIQKSCFVCDEKFKEEDNLSLLFNGNSLNQLCCEKCSQKLINSN